MEKPSAETNPVLTIGHGDRALDEFLACLAAGGAEVVIDVRSAPVSRRQPWSSREALEPSLATAGYAYRWLGRELGGLRSIPYEEHMGTPLFREGFERLVRLARERTAAVLCAERSPADCHRRHLARELQRAGFAVRHVLDPDRILGPGEGPDDQGTLFPI